MTKQQLALCIMLSMNIIQASNTPKQPNGTPQRPVVTMPMIIAMLLTAEAVNDLPQTQQTPASPKKQFHPKHHLPYEQQPKHSPKHRK